jgi:hypothetical protein
MYLRERTFAKTNTERTPTAMPTTAEGEKERWRKNGRGEHSVENPSSWVEAGILSGLRAQQQGVRMMR